MTEVKISSTGLYLPPVVQTAAELAPLIGRSEKWITKRAGVAERRIASETMDVMAARAAREALGNGRPPDCVINASATPLQTIPDSSPFILRQLGLRGVASWSVHATCLSFLVATVNAATLVQADVFEKVLIVSSENATPLRNLDDPDSAALFGDGAAAAVVERAGPGEPSRIIDWQMTTWPEGAEATELRAGSRRFFETQTDQDYMFRMDGPQIVKLAVPLFTESISSLLSKNDLSMQDIDWVVPHQASPIVFIQLRRLGFPADRIVRTLASTGNTVAASIPMALAHADRDGRLKRGDLLLVGGTGAGLSIAFALVTW